MTDGKPNINLLVWLEGDWSQSEASYFEPDEDLLWDFAITTKIEEKEEIQNPVPDLVEECYRVKYKENKPKPANTMNSIGTPINGNNTNENPLETELEDFVNEVSENNDICVNEWTILYSGHGSREHPMIFGTPKTERIQNKNITINKLKELLEAKREDGSGTTKIFNAELFLNSCYSHVVTNDSILVGSNNRIYSCSSENREEIDLAGIVSELITDSCESSETISRYVQNMIAEKRLTHFNSFMRLFRGTRVSLNPVAENPKTRSKDTMICIPVLRSGACSILYKDQEALLFDTSTAESIQPVWNHFLSDRINSLKVVISHSDQDHIGGLVALSKSSNTKQRLDRLYWNYEEIVKQFRSFNSVEVVSGNLQNSKSGSSKSFNHLEGDEIKWKDSIKATALHPSKEFLDVFKTHYKAIKCLDYRNSKDSNATSARYKFKKQFDKNINEFANKLSCITEVQVGQGKKMLFTGDADAEDIKRVTIDQKKKKDYFVFEVPHHGSIKQYSEETYGAVKTFYEQFNVKYYIIQAGWKNSYKFPSLDVVKGILESNNQCKVIVAGYDHRDPTASNIQALGDSYGERLQVYQPVKTEEATEQLVVSINIFTESIEEKKIKI